MADGRETVCKVCAFSKVIKWMLLKSSVDQKQEYFSFLSLLTNTVVTRYDIL